MGLRCGVIDVHDAMLMIGTMITVPARCVASIRGMRRCIATIELYSVPWLPATNATTGPGRVPWMTATGMSSAESTPAGTLISPVAVVPRLAAAVPTVKEVSPCCCAAATDAKASMRVAARWITVIMELLVHVGWNQNIGRRVTRKAGARSVEEPANRAEHTECLTSATPSTVGSPAGRPAPCVFLAGPHPFLRALRANLRYTLSDGDLQLGSRPRGVVEVGKRHAWERFADRPLDRAKIVRLFRRHESKRLAGHLRARRSADSMYVVFALRGNVEVDDVA